MRVLITNHALAKRAGTELYVRDLCSELLRQGHEPMVFSCILGAVSDEITRMGVTVVDSLSKINEPSDVIHAHHWFETAMAAMAFPKTPILHICHGARPWLEHTPSIASIAVHGAVDFACRERVSQDTDVPESDVRVFHNFVDMARFKPRAALPEKLQRAAVFSNYASEDGQVPAIREACRQHGIKLDVVGEEAGALALEPERVLPTYDLVFAKGRAALEALAVGCAVILCDRNGAGPLVRRSEIEDLRDWNFGLRKLTEPVTPKHLSAQIQGYDRTNAEQCSAFVREHCALTEAVGLLLASYQDAIAKDLPSEADVVRSAVSEWESVRKALGDKTWVFDPPAAEQARFGEGRWRRKMRSIGRRSMDLLREFAPRQN